MCTINGMTFCAPPCIWSRDTYFAMIQIVAHIHCGRLCLKCDGTRAETRFRVSAKQTSPFKPAGWCQFSWLLAAEVCTSAVVMVVMLYTQFSEVVWRILATHSICQFPLHLALLCVTVCHHISTGLYCTFTEYHGISCREVIQLCLLLIGYMQQSTQDTHNLCMALVCKVLRRELYYTKI
jgi:hypothetical protein